MPIWDHLTAELPSKEALAAFVFSERGTWTVVLLALIALLLLIAWRLHARRVALENLGLPRLRRELSDLFKLRQEPLDEAVETDIIALEGVSPAVQSAQSASATGASTPMQGTSLDRAPHVTADMAPDDVPQLMGRLAFEPRAGLGTAAATLGEIRVDAVFVSDALLGSLSDAALKLLPFAPEAHFHPSFNNVYHRGVLIAQPRAVLAVAGGMAVVTESVQSGPLSPDHNWVRQLRQDELILAILNAMVVAHELNVPCAPILAFDGARLLLRPSTSLVLALVREQARAIEFALSLSKRNSLTTIVYASLFAAAAA